MIMLDGMQFAQDVLLGKCANAFNSNYDRVFESTPAAIRATNHM